MRKSKYQYDLQMNNNYLIITLCYIFIHFQPIFPAILFLQEPFNVRFWPIRFSSHSQNTAIKQISFALGFFLDTWTNIFLVFPTGFVVVLLVIYFAKLKFWIHIVQQNLKLEGSIENSLKYYKIVELINQIGFCCMSTTILPAIYTNAHAFATIILASLAKRSSGMSLDVKLNMCGAVFVILVGINTVIKVAGEILNVSQQTKQAFGKRMIKKELRKQVLASRDIRVYVNSVFYMEKGTFTVFLTSVINNAITIILAT